MYRVIFFSFIIAIRRLYLRRLPSKIDFELNFPIVNVRYFRNFTLVPNTRRVTVCEWHQPFRSTFNKTKYTETRTFLCGRPYRNGFVRGKKNQQNAQLIWLWPRAPTILPILSPGTHLRSITKSRKSDWKSIVYMWRVKMNLRKSTHVNFT